MVNRKRSQDVRVAHTFVTVVLALLCTSIAAAQQAGEKTFSTPGDGVLAAYDAFKANDETALKAIFGPSVTQIIHTGDDVADKNTIANFLRRYDQMHRVVIEPDGTATVYVGAENWPMPISLVKNSNGSWYFDTESGIQEILYRRIGTNENDAIDVLHTLADAQHEYYAGSSDNPKTRHYAAKFLSKPGERDGLYWKTSESETPSPIGPLIADASGEGYTGKQGEQTPFHGYYYRILDKQGAAAKGGAHNYLSNGQLTGGFAFVAYPAQYRNSGVMTFIVDKDGVVYEKDLSEDTEKVAVAMSAYNPDGTWRSAD